MHRSHVINARYFVKAVWNLLWRGKLLYPLGTEIGWDLFPLFSPMDQGNFRAVTSKFLMGLKLQCSVFSAISGRDDLCACRSMTLI